MKYLLILSIFVSTLVGCSGIQDDFKQYLDEGETIYVGKLDSIVVHPGKNRVMIEGLMPYGITQTKCVFTWTTPSGLAEVEEFDIVRNTQEDKFQFVIAPLEEGQHDFKVVTLDAKGNSSIVVQVGGYSYGEIYQSTLGNRQILKIESDSDNDDDARIDWLPINHEQFNGCEIEYDKIDGTKASLTVGKTDATTTLPGYKPQGVLKWRSLYLPDVLAIDVFTTEWDETKLP
ncbi:DUF4998 domain-containing protein [Bacteroides sp. 51]|uniref:DUF4998 domain-containing protein n=1 Tax=Bacteroides sp. 51 TaxID=2302938 RepID=UPI0013D03933|nr:DUF4998 domain-containing protein [Bacteroides sp. 51]NDV80997.1 hypothetical protein [Bacteroides sp. 51]